MHRVFQAFIDGLAGSGDVEHLRSVLANAGAALDLNCFAYLSMHRPEETTVNAAVRLCAHLAGGILPIQGPPGAGKTFSGAHMICELARLGKKGRNHRQQPQSDTKSDRRNYQGR